MTNFVTNEEVTEKILKEYIKEPGDLAKFLFPMLRLLDPNKEIREVVEAIPHFCDDLNITDFINLMVKLGFNSEVENVSLTSYNDDKCPSIFISDDGESFIITSIEADVLRVQYPDGTLRQRRLDGTKGFIIYLSKLEPDKTTGSWFRKVLIRYKSLFSQVFIITVIYNALVISVPIYVMSIYDKVLPGDSPNMLIAFSVGILLVVVMMNYLNVLRTKALAYIGARLEKSVGYVVVQDILYLPPGYTENTGVGNQIARIKDFDSIRDFISSPVMLSFMEIPTTFLFILVIFILGGGLALIPIGLAVVFHAMYIFTNPVMNTYTTKRGAQQSARQDFLLETLENVKEIKLAGCLDNWMYRLKLMSLDLAQSCIKISNLSIVINSVSETLMMLSGLLIVFFGAQMAMENEISAGGLIAIMLLTWKVLQPIKFFFANLPRLEQIKNSIAQVNNLMRLKTELVPRENAKLLETEAATLEFSRLSFKYQVNLPPALLGVTFKVQPNELLCITGGNGSGKTTLLRLILGMYQPQAGSIFINGRNIKQIPPIYLRQSIAYLPQTVKFFFGTIKQNLKFTNPQASDYHVQIAARMANIHTEIMGLPEQYNTKIGENTELRFSASFLQRLGLARTFLTKSNLLLLDEPETSLDYDSNNKFIQTMKWLSKGNTIVMVTHRPSHLRMADKIINLKEGQIAQYGPPEQVMPHL